MLKKVLKEAKLFNNARMFHRLVHELPPVTDGYISHDKIKKTHLTISTPTPEKSDNDYANYLNEIYKTRNLADGSLSKATIYRNSIFTHPKETGCNYQTYEEDRVNNRLEF